MFSDHPDPDVESRKSVQISVINDGIKNPRFDEITLDKAIECASKLDCQQT